ncbi:MAG: hypothetical protein KL863_02935 [Rhizobium sp.]|nr:hypothetical protein [Rhizobium sp.]
MHLSATRLAAMLAISILAATPAFGIEATTYKGTIGKIAIIVEMSDVSDADRFFARYAYMSRGADIPLHGRINDDGSLAIEEEAPCDPSCRNTDGDIVEDPPIGADWTLARQDRTGAQLKGMWTDRKSGKSLVVTLERVGTRTLGDGAETLDALDPVNVIAGWTSRKITPALLPYDFLKLDYPVKRGPETTFQGATIRLDTDPRTETSYPVIVTLPGTATGAINGYLQQQWLQFQFNPYYCKSTAYLGFGWSGSGGQGTTGLDGGSSAEIEYLTDRLLGLVENGSSYCGGAHPNHFENRHFADVRTGEPIEAERLLKGWVPKNPDGQDMDPAMVVDENNQRYGPNADLVAFINARRDTSDASIATDCGMSDLVASNLGVYFTRNELVFNLRNLPHVIFACTGDLLRIPLREAKPLLTEDGVRYLGLGD